MTYTCKGFYFYSSYIYYNIHTNKIIIVIIFICFVFKKFIHIVIISYEQALLVVHSSVILSNCVSHSAVIGRFTI